MLSGFIGLEFPSNPSKHTYLNTYLLPHWCAYIVAKESQIIFEKRDAEQRPSRIANMAPQYKFESRISLFSGEGILLRSGTNGVWAALSNRSNGWRAAFSNMHGDLPLAVSFGVGMLSSYT